MVACVGADLSQLLGDHEPVLLVADHHRLPQLGQPLQTGDGLLEHGPVGDQGQELFGIELAGQGPEPAAGTAGENDGDDHRNSFCIFIWFI